MPPNLDENLFSGKARGTSREGSVYRKGKKTRLNLAEDAKQKAGLPETAKQAPRVCRKKCMLSNTQKGDTGKKGGGAGRLNTIVLPRQILEATNTQALLVLQG